ncbi:SOS response-associated peptidase [Agathobaculum sp.]|uniref:SOS response-associated peptidase n=1 Tax=Agathobaculum sp. TaxID=2048138 RepID=UPI002A839820|nr:SOS response-associated peptidase [Agathobaculum sp.]MDY3617646.1 SOS response-associated peptidase [Agathobaculum sp.]
MCGRYQFSLDEPTLRQYWETARERFPNVHMETGEIFPTHVVPVLLEEESGVVPEPVKWGFPRFNGGGVVINARSETAGEKRMFRQSLMTRRCVVPTSGFFEWSHDKAKNKYRFKVPGSSVLYLAGLWNEFSGERRFVILTEAANPSIADIHDRMPVLLEPEQVEAWIRDNEQVSALLAQEAPALEREEEGNVQQSLC